MPSYKTRSLCTALWLAAAGCLVALAAPVADPALPTATPESVGLSSAALDRITRKLQKYTDKGILPGASFVVLRSGKKVYEGNVGYADKQFGLPYTSDTICRVMSQSKAVTATAILMLIEDGKLRLNTTLDTFNKKFGSMKVIKNVDKDGNVLSTVPAKRVISIFDLLTFTAGFSYSFQLPNDKKDGTTDFPEFSPLMMLQLSRYTLDQFVDQLASQPLVAQPGSEFYYGWCFDVLGFVIQKVTGQSPDVFLAQRIFTPLGMKDTGFYVPAAKMGRFAAEYYTDGGPMTTMIAPRIDPLQGYRTPTLILCGAGLVSTANDFAKFAQMLLNGGVLNGVRVLSEASVDMLWRNQLLPSQLPYKVNEWVSDDKTGYGLGVGITTQVPTLSVKWNERTGARRMGDIGWGGGATTNWQASAELDIVCTFMTQLLSDAGEVTVFEDVWTDIYAAVTGPSPRKPVGSVPTIPPKMGGRQQPKNTQIEDNQEDATRGARRRKKRRRDDDEDDDTKKRRLRVYVPVYAQ